MKYCCKCGAQLLDEAVLCPKCGCQVGGMDSSKDATTYNFSRTRETSEASPIVEEGSMVVWGFLGFFIPFVGLILFCVWHHDRPRAAKASGVGALIRVIASVVFVFLIFLILFIRIGSGAVHYYG
jgi:uncharacterized membrane protein YvbJ